MGKYIVHNGVLVKTDEFIVSPNNRAFCYGDGVFETIRCLNGNPLFFNKHFARVKKALKSFKIELSKELSEAFFQLQIQKLLKLNRIYQGARVKLLFYRKDGGLYTPQSNEACFTITADSLEEQFFILNEKGLVVNVYSDLLKQINLFSPFKTCNSMVFVMAGLWRKENEFSDCFIVNEQNKIIEALASNVFIVKDNILFTPLVESGCVDGTMRRTIIEIAQKENFMVREHNGFSEENLLQADEIFLTNAIQGVNWVGAFKERRYFHKMASFFVLTLNKIVSSV